VLSDRVVNTVGVLAGVAMVVFGKAEILGLHL